MGRFKQRFDPVERELFYQRQPEFYLEGVDVNTFTLASQVAKVRLPSSYVCLFIDVGRPRVSKNARRKAHRYGKVDPVQQTSVEAVLTTAVRKYKGQ